MHSRTGFRQRLSAGGLSALFVLSLMASSIAAPLVSAAPPAPSSGDPTQVSFTLEGCRNNGNIFLPNTDGKFICPNSAYTSGNLGKGWNELDLVPYRLTASTNTAQTYSVVIALDGADAGKPGYDVISVPTLNTALSSGTCTLTASAQQSLSPGIGGTDTTIYRTLTITQSAGSTCVWDYYGRLALGSHLYPGSSLHANLTNRAFGTGGVGARDVSIPVKEISPQELSKDMTATQGSDHVWDITKSATPAEIHFGDTCDTSTSLSAAVSVTISWTKGPADASGPITVITHVYATNPASRAITTNVTDVIYSGTTALTSASASANVPANTTLLVLTHQTTVPAGTTNLNDIATGTYTDLVTGVAIPGSTTATASATVQPSGPELNASAVITDVESISGTGLSFSADSFTGATGTFDAGYVAGTHTTGSVGWTSASQTDSGSVTFAKTVYVTTATSTSGTLSDIATLTGSDGFTADADASVAIDSTRLVSLTIAKTIPNVLSGSETASFTFDVKTGGASGTVVATRTFNFTAGEFSKSSTITGLSAGTTYTVVERPATGWAAQPSQDVTISGTNCAATVTFNNAFAPASAMVRKVTVPAGSESGWEFTLTGPGAPLLGEKVTTTGTGFVNFTTVLEEGSYTITETAQTGFDQTFASADCSFTVNYPADAGRVYSCTYTNTARGTIIVEKQTLPDGSAATFGFTGTAAGTIGDGGSITVTDLVPGTYTSTEATKAGWTLKSIVCDDGSSTTPSTTSGRTATFKLDAGETITCVFTNEELGHGGVIKTLNGAALTGSTSFEFQLRSGASVTSQGTVLETKYATGTNGGVFSFAYELVPGTTYALCENIAPGWTGTIATDPNRFVPASSGVPPESVDNTYVCVSFTVTAGETKTFTLDNVPPPGGMAKTIGFWKNHAVCKTSKGGQADVLGTVLATAPGGGFLVGNLFVNTCPEAVSLLNKSTLAGKKQASDPAYNFAAQYVAYQLNYLAGAYSSTTAANAAASGQAILVAINFDGTGSYTKTLTAAQAAALNSYARILDNYNNNTL